MNTFFEKKKTKSENVLFLKKEIIGRKRGSLSSKRGIENEA